MCLIIKCKYYPCHFPQQDCTHCFCLFYPCKNEKTGGKWYTSSNGVKIWDCTKCYTIHYSDVVRLIRLKPDENDRDKIRESWERLEKWLESNTEESKGNK